MNGANESRELELDLGGLEFSENGILITDAGEGNLSFRREKVQVSCKERPHIELYPHGGFVLVF